MLAHTQHAYAHTQLWVYRLRPLPVWLWPELASACAYDRSGMGELRLDVTIR